MLGFRRPEKRGNTDGAGRKLSVVDRGALSQAPPQGMGNQLGVSQKCQEPFLQPPGNDASPHGRLKRSHITVTPFLS